jgi:murein DD-endopeptidase MepM/ murein hydrolase activator NlpD
MREQAADKELLAKQKAQVETKLAEQENRRAELGKLKASLDSQKAQQAGLVKDLQAEQNRLASEKANMVQQREEAIDVTAELEQQIMAEQERLAELARKAEEERQRKLAAERAAQEKAAAEAAARQAAEERAAAEAAAASAKAKASASSSAPAPAPKQAAAYSAPAVKQAVSSNFIRPTSGRYTSKFGWRDIGAGQEFHQGVDIANSVGTNVMAAAGGFVSYAGSMGGYGNVVILTHSINGQTHATVYAHLSSIGVGVGQSVTQGQSVGKMGNTGRSFGSHLHFEIHVGPWNGGRTNAVNPANYISL